MNKFKYFGLFCIVVTSTSYASGFRIPEQSGDAVATATANIAAAFSADAAYYNPSNMSYLPHGHLITFSSTYLHAGKQKFSNEDTKFGPYNYDTTSKSGDFYIPTFHFVSPVYSDKFRFGFSMVSPAGLSMRWSDPYPRSVSEIFQIKVAEAAPSISYQVNEDISFALGVRALYARGKARNKVKDAQIVPNTPFKLNAQRSIKGDSLDFGYNLAFTYRPVPDLSFAATYRSKINMTLKGDTKIYSSTNLPNGHPAKQIFDGSYEGDISIDVPLPAIFTLATSYKYDQFTFMAAYDRTFWSKLKEFDFEYPQKVPFSDMFDKPIEKKWRDTNTYRFALAYHYSNELRLMAGFAYDEAAAKSDKIRFELPDTKAYVYSLGANYKINESLDITAGYLYQDRQKRKVNSSDKVSFNNVVGTFERNNIQIMNLSLNYRF